MSTSTLNVNQSIISPKSLSSNNKPIFTLERKAWLHFVAGGVGGCIGTIVFSPLEVVKTRFQSSLYKQNIASLGNTHGIYQTARYHVFDTLNAIRKLYINEGTRALFKGLGPTLSGVIPSRSIYFFSYGNGKNFFTQLNSGKETALVHLSSAAIAGIITATVTNPIWVVRTRMQLQSESARAYKNSLHCLYQVIRQEGIKGIYKGMSASYLGVIESATQWVVYEQLKKVALKRKDVNKDKSKSVSDWIDTLACAGTAKLFAAVVAYPHEVLRTRLRQNPIDQSGQYKYNGLWQCIKLIYKEEGFLAFYGGLTPHLLRVVPNAAILFGTYEMIMHYFGN